MQSEVSEILRQNENHLSAKFVEAQKEIKNLRDVIEGSGQGNQGVQQEVDDIVETLKGKLAKSIKGELGKVIANKKDLLSQNVKEI